MTPPGLQTNIGLGFPGTGDKGKKLAGKFRWQRRNGTMVEITAISSGLAATKAGIDIIKILFQSAKTSGQIEVQNQLMDLQQKLLDAQSSLNDADRDNQGLQQQISNLEEKLAWKSNLEFDTEEQAYRQVDNPEPDQGRFCANCWDGRHQISRLLPKVNTDAVMKKSGLVDFSVWFCTICEVYSHRTAKFEVL